MELDQPALMLNKHVRAMTEKEVGRLSRLSLCQDLLGVVAPELSHL
jgi:hypothetical protein